MRKRLRREVGERSVEVRAARCSTVSNETLISTPQGNLSGQVEIEARKQWVGFDDEVVIVLKENEAGTQALMVYDFT